MKIQQFQQRNLTLHGPWKWLLTEFASYYGVSDAYTRLRYNVFTFNCCWCCRSYPLTYYVFMCVIVLQHQLCRYLSYVMDVATPTADCLTVVHELLLPVIMKGRSKSTLSHQEVTLVNWTLMLFCVFKIPSFSATSLSSIKLYLTSAFLYKKRVSNLLAYLS